MSYLYLKRGDKAQLLSNVGLHFSSHSSFCNTFYYNLFNNSFFLTPPNFVSFPLMPPLFIRAPSPPNDANQPPHGQINGLTTITHARRSPT